MFDDMSDIEIITRIEKRFGPLSKSLVGEFTTDSVDKIEGELLSILNKYKVEYSIPSPIPRVRSWMQGNKVCFLFFDRGSGRRVILGDWLSQKIAYYEK